MEVVTSIVSKIAELLVEPIGRQCGYLIYHKSNIKDLQEEADKLHDIWAGLQLSVQAAERNGEVIAPNVAKWLTKVGELVKELKKILEEDIQQNKNCLHLKSYYSLSRKAKKKTVEVIKLQEDGKFDKISYPPVPPKIGPVYAEVKGFESRILIMNEVLKVLKDDMISMIGICGMGGVGKTTMMKQIIKIVERENLFDKVVMAVVSQNPDFKTIQGELADGLGLKFDRETVSGRAVQLHQKLKSLKRVLIILDDVWSELKIEAIGIPSRDDHNGCKIVLASRSKDVCNKMKCVKIFEIMLLSEEESWNLFKEMAGDSIDYPDLLPIAKEVVKECGGLPIALVTVAKALEDKEKYVWRDALLQLQKSTITSFSEMNEFVFSPIELSYTYLRNEEIKSCFLLCCLFPEDFNIPVEYLVRYGVGLRIFKGVGSLVEARNRVHAIIDKLKRLFLLLESDRKEHVKMHDVVRDAAISIASKQESVFVVRCDNQLKEFPNEGACKLCSAISLVFETIEGDPSAPEYQKLEFLQLISRHNRQKIPHKLFEGMNELKVLSLQFLMIPSQPLSPQVLNKLQTLCLENCYLPNVFVLGALENLEILSLASSSMLSFSIEIGQLRHLRLLDLTDCFVRKFPPGVLSRLSRIEELYMRMRYGSNPSLGELRSLSHLTTLDIDIRDPEGIPKDLFFQNLIRFRISVNFEIYSPRIYLFQNRLAVKCDARDIRESCIFGLLKKTEALFLNLKNLKNVVYDLDQDHQGFPVLKELSLERCSDLEYLIDVGDCAPCTTFPSLEALSLCDLVNLKDLWHLELPGESTLSKQTDLMAPFQREPLPLQSESPRVLCFGNLKFLEISKCCMLKSVFSAPVGRGLVHLQDLYIHDCQEMEEIFSKAGEDDIPLSKLTKLTLFKLPKLNGFCKEMKDPVTKQPCSNNQVELCNNLELSSSQKEMIRNCQHDQFEACSSLQTRNHLLKSSGKVLFTPYWISRIPNIKFLLVNVGSFEAVFDLKGINVKEGKSIETFGQLEELDLYNLFELTNIWTNVPKGFQGFNKLRKLRVEWLHSLRYLFTPPIIELLVELQQLEIKHCDAMENILSREEEEEEQKTLSNITFHKVCYVSLESLPALASFCSDAYSFEWPSLETLYIYGCHEMKTFGSTIQSPPKINNAKDGASSTIKKFDDLNHHSLVPVQDSHGFSHWFFRCPCFCGTIKSNQGSTRRNIERWHQEEEKLQSKGSMSQQTLKEEATLPELTDSKTRNTNNMKEILPLFPSSLLNGLQRLQELELNSCGSMEVVFDLVGKNVVEGQIVSTVNALQRLTLAALPNLLHIWKVGSENMRGFQNLKLIKISYCNSLRSLIPVSIATLLVQLETIKITSCEMMEDVIAKGEKERIEQIMFPKLNSIVLEGLPLLSFCSEACAIEFPFLTKMRVVSCPNLGIFVLANVTTPKLKEVETELVPYKLMGDLNDTIHDIFIAKNDRTDEDTLTKEQIDGTINDDGSQKI